MPEQTNEDVVSGFIGLTVVLARRNEMTPARLKLPPARAIVTAAATRMYAVSSSACMRMIMRHDASVELGRAASCAPLERAVMRQCAAPIGSSWKTRARL